MKSPLSDTHPCTNARPGRFLSIAADTTRKGSWQNSLKDADVVINLAGMSIFQRWTSAYKQRIYDSRILTTRHVVEGLTGDRPQTLISTSAVGYYGSRGDDILTEAEPSGTDFLSRVGQDWEHEAFEAEKKNVRVVAARFGVVLGRSGGALKQMITPFKWCVGGPMGSGRQWFSWIHIADLAGRPDVYAGKCEDSGTGESLLTGSGYQRRAGKDPGRRTWQPRRYPRAFNGASAHFR